MPAGILELGGTTVRAVSAGGLETCIEVPSWRLCFDIGRCPPTAARLPTVLFTHAHADHMGGVVLHCSQRDMMRMPAPRYVVPAENEVAFADMLDAWRRLDRSPLPCEVQAVGPGDRVDLGRGRSARVFRAVHRVPSLGYVLYETRARLRPELVGKPTEEIAALARAGAPVSDLTEVPVLAFCGDTTIDVLEREEMVRTAPTLLLEVTFLDDRVPVAAARAMGHVHLDEVIERAELFGNERIVFTHFSVRYANDEIVRILDARLPASLRERVVPLLHVPPWDRSISSGS